MERKQQRVITPEEFELRMIELRDNQGTCAEARHSIGDDMMCEILKELGYANGVDVFINMERWYA